MRTIAVIGKNFGDEGKGFTCSCLASSLKNALIIKHNGGGQAGHTVEDPKGKWRFIHHQIGAGAEYHVPTLFADSFMPDLFQLGKEVKAFTELFGFRPILYSEKNARVTTVEDVLLNMGAELARGKNRHGSCGMGIEECVQRNAAGYGITVEELAGWTKQDLVDRLKQIRKEYTGRRAKILGIYPSNPYYEMLYNEIVLKNFVEEVKKNVNLLTLVDADRKWLEEIKHFQHLIFETGQGLLLDQDYEAYAPHLTSSKTGIHNPAVFLEKRGLFLDEAIYVTRPYVTRHGNGPLPCEVDPSELPGVGEDLTNRPNEWQGTLRYAKHESLEAFFAPVLRDRDSVNCLESMGETKRPKHPKLSILVTQLSETGNQLYFDEGSIPFETFQKAGEELGISCIKDI
ncbi:adenylosuccinate synthetase [Oribacterium sinus]|uniref:Adenylosuccinate synthetase n=1 Tax=Oribacterium sinus F0268 TaxID=585501 RepID=C2KVK7_9FIRM|nr:adenylosuccinate synthetase [Oribacterium sinus]EEJ52181.1 putative adenylosuccinate synthase [Oribacterium sinus F0268]